MTSHKHGAIFRLTSSLALPLFLTPSINRLYVSAKNEVRRILISGAFYQREKLPGYPPQLAHVQLFATTKTTGKSRGLTTLHFAQLNPVRPSGPPYLHSVYSLTASRIIKICLLYLPTQIRFPIGGERVTCHGSKLTNSLKKQRLELSTRT